MTTTDDQRLYGPPDAEHLGFDLDEAAREQVGLGWLPEGETFEIWEYDVHPPSYHLPTAEQVCMWIAETTVDGEMDEHCADEFWDVAQADDARAVIQQALDLIASKVTYRMAHRHLATHTFRVPPADAEDDAPILVRTEPVEDSAS